MLVLLETKTSGLQWGLNLLAHGPILNSSVLTLTSQGAVDCGGSRIPAVSLVRCRWLRIRVFWVLGSTRASSDRKGIVAPVERLCG